MSPFQDYRGKPNMFRYVMKFTTMAIAGELAAAAELAMGKTDGIPVVIIRGYDFPRGEGSAREMVRPIEKNLFR